MPFGRERAEGEEMVFYCKMLRVTCRFFVDRSIVCSFSVKEMHEFYVI